MPVQIQPVVCPDTNKGMMLSDFPLFPLTLASLYSAELLESHLHRSCGWPHRSYGNGGRKPSHLRHSYSWRISGENLTMF